MNDVTLILQAINRGDGAATEQLLDAVYSELRQLAAAKLARERPGQTLQATALVNEVYLRLFGDAADEHQAANAIQPTDETESSANAGTLSEAMSNDGTSAEDVLVQWHSRRHFFAAAAEAMRRILIERARSKKAIKRGGDRDRVDFELADFEVASPSTDILALDEALEKLEREDQQKAAVVKLRYFAGLTIEQTAQALEISQPTVKRYWYYARAWLRREMGAAAESS